MRRRLIIIGLVAGVMAAAGAVVFAAGDANEVKAIKWNEAGQYYDKIVAVEGLVIAVRDTQQAIYLEFDEDPDKGFLAVIMKADMGKFPVGGGGYYLNKVVKMTGKIRDLGRPMMRLRDPNQIEIVEQARPVLSQKGAEADGGQMNELLREVRDLRIRVNNLEKRLDAIERNQGIQKM